MRLLKTPLRYPGGKSRACVRLYDWFPADIDEFREPFVGGGSVALYFSQLHPDVPVWINDLYVPLYHFWINLRDRGDELSETCYDIKLDHPTPDLARELFDKSKVEIQTADSFRQAVLFWVLNKCSYSGLTENSSFSQSASKQNFTLRGANNLKKYQEVISKWEITCLDYTECLQEEGENIFQFLDPPYKIGSYLYGRDAGLHKEFDHAKFAEDCKDAEGKWMITYNIDDEIEEMFKNYNQRYFSMTYGMQHRPDNTKKAELLITNYDEEPTNPLEQLLYG